MDIVIHVENLGKLYRLGLRQTNRTLREAITGAASAPFRRLAHSFNSNFDSNKSNSEYFWALKDVSFDVEEGKVLGIIGRNGSGKSTLLKILSRITVPTEGKADIYGRVGSLLEVGTGFHPELTGRENVFLSGSILGMKKSEIEDKFDEIVKFSEIETFLDTPVKRYSSGMHVRLAFAVAAHLDPEILLIDEVLAVGDAVFQKKCLGKMKNVAREGRTVLFVSHHMNAIEQLCDSCMLLENGKLKDYSDNVRNTVNNYLFANKDDINSSEWINHGENFDNPWFRPLEFYIGDESGNKLTMPVSNNSDFWVHIRGIVEKINALTVGYAIYNENGDLLYWSYQTDEKEENWISLKTGINNLSSKLPQRLLNEGAYRLELIANIHGSRWISKPGANAPYIYLTIKGGLSDSPYMFRRPGLLAPIMNWKVKYEA